MEIADRGEKAVLILNNIPTREDGSQSPALVAIRQRIEKAALMHGNITIVRSATTQEYLHMIEQDPAALNKYQAVTSKLSIRVHIGETLLCDARMRGLSPAAMNEYVDTVIRRWEETSLAERAFRWNGRLEAAFVDHVITEVVSRSTPVVTRPGEAAKKERADRDRLEARGVGTKGLERTRDVERQRGEADRASEFAKRGR